MNARAGQRHRLRRHPRPPGRGCGGAAGGRRAERHARAVRSLDGGALQLGPLGPRRRARDAQPHHRREARRGGGARPHRPDGLPLPRPGGRPGRDVPARLRERVRLRRARPRRARGVDRGAAPHRLPREPPHPPRRTLPRGLGRHDLQRPPLRRDRHGRRRLHEERRLSDPRRRRHPRPPDEHAGRRARRRRGHRGVGARDRHHDHAGDALFLWTAGSGGFDNSIMPFLRERDLALLLADSGVVDGGPIEGRTTLPMHMFTLVALGMPLIDGADLEPLAATAAELDRYEFLFVIAPLRVPNGAGSAINPARGVLTARPRFTGPPPRATVDGWGGPARRAPVQRG